MSLDVLEQIVSQANTSLFYAIQLDESNDVTAYHSILYLVDTSVMGSIRRAAVLQNPAIAYLR